MKMIHRGQTGLTLIELLIVIAILGIIAAVIIPNIAGFITSGNVAAANTEAENVKTASLGYYAGVGNNTWPSTSDVLTATGYLSGVLKATYYFDANTEPVSNQYGWILSANSTATGWKGTSFVAGTPGPTGGHGHWVAGNGT